MSHDNRRDAGRLFDDVPHLYDRVRPGYPSELIDDLVAIAGLSAQSRIVEVGCGTGQATRPLAERGHHITAVEPGAGLAALARENLATFPNVEIENSSFEDWDAQGRRFDLLVAASSWHWIDPSVGWRRAHEIVEPGGWMAILGNAVARPSDEPELYAATADLHQQWAPDNPDWGHPPTAAEVRATSRGWGPPNEDTEGFFGPTTVRWCPTVQWFDGSGIADHLRSLSPYRRLDDDVREPLLDAIADRVRTRLGDRIGRHYLSLLRAGQRRGEPVAGRSFTPAAPPDCS
ncbi:MAG: methyltransferase domain-containing protein [Acidimicrobiales bacterium]